MHSIDISYASLAVGLLLLLVPAYYIWRYETGLLKSICVGAVRMIFQMLFIGVYLRYLFQWDNPWVNCLGCSSWLSLPRRRRSRARE